MQRLRFEEPQNRPIDLRPLRAPMKPSGSSGLQDLEGRGHALARHDELASFSAVADDRREVVGKNASSGTILRTWARIAREVADSLRPLC
jgi:hypothetical protein